VSLIPKQDPGITNFSIPKLKIQSRDCNHWSARFARLYSFNHLDFIGYHNLQVQPLHTYLARHYSYTILWEFVHYRKRRKRI